MQNIILVGAGGCMRELVWQIQELNKVKPSWNILGYVDVVPPENNEYVTVGMQKVSYLGTDEILIHSKENINVVLCIGSPRLRKKIAINLMQNKYISFPNMILLETYICDDVKLGQGCIVSMDARISTNTKVGDFVFLNTGSMICHDGIIGDYVTLSPDVKVAGAVRVGNGTELGIGSKVIQGISIGENVIIGAGGIVVRDIQSNCTAVGVPAKVIK